jgi:hypothetical protein
MLRSWAAFPRCRHFEPSGDSFRLDQAVIRTSIEVDAPSIEQRAAPAVWTGFPPAASEGGQDHSGGSAPVHRPDSLLLVVERVLALIATTIISEHGWEAIAR